MIETPAISVTDNADGTATVTIQGGEPLAVNTVRYQRFRGLLGSGAGWLGSESRVGPGEVTPIGSGPGYFWWRVDSELDGENTIANLVYQSVTDGEQAIHHRIRDAIADRLLALQLPAIGDRVYPKLTASSPNVTYPCAHVVIGDVEQYLAGPNESDDIGYPVQVLFSDRQERETDGGTALVTLWRQMVSDAFRNQRLPGITEVQYCTIVPSLIVDPEDHRYQMVIGGLAVNAITRRGRGM